MLLKRISPTTPAHHASRWRVVHAAAGFGIFARLLSISCTLAQVPIALRYLGGEAFGLWMTLTSIASLLAVGDLGLNLGAKTMLADAHGRDDAARLRALADECFRELLWLGGAVAALGLALAWGFNWPAIFGVASPALAAALPWALTGLAIAAGATIATALGPTLAAALQLPWVQHATLALGGLLTLVTVVIAVAFQASWLTLVLCALALPVIVNSVVLCWLRWRLGWRGRATSRLPVEERRKLRRLGRWFMVPQIGSLFMIMSVPIAIAMVAGPIAVTAFNLLQRVFGVVNQTHWIALSALWPAYSEAHARGDHAWMREAYRRSWRATLLAFIPATLVLALLMPGLVALWVGGKAPPISNALLWISAGWFAVQQLGQPPALLLNGLGRLQRVSIYGGLGHVLSLSGMLIGGRIAGPTGVIAGMAAGYLAAGLPVAIAEAARAVQRLPS